MDHRLVTIFLQLMLVEAPLEEAREAWEKGVHDIPSFCKLPLLANWKMLIYFSWLVLTEYATNKSKQTRKGW
jgi:hypothetical protein